MAPSISSDHPPARKLGQLAALRALANELNGDRRHYRRQPVEPLLAGHLELDQTNTPALPLLLIDLGSGGARAITPATALVPTDSRGRLLTGPPDRPTGMRQVRVRWVKAQGSTQLLGLAFE